MKKIVILLIPLILALSITGCYRSNINNYNNVTDISTDEKKDYSECFNPPVFLQVNDGVEEIKKIPLKNKNLQIYSRYPYVFISFDSYIVRYNLKMNFVDRVIKLATLNRDSYYTVTISSDGCYIIAYSLSYNSQESTGYNYYLIDLNTQTFKLLAEVYSSFAVDKAKNHISKDLQKEYYNLSFSIEELKSDRINESKFIRSIYDEFDNRYIITSVIDYNTVAVFAPMSPDTFDILENYCIFIVDLNEDCVINNLSLNR